MPTQTLDAICICTEQCPPRTRLVPFPFHCLTMAPKRNGHKPLRLPLSDFTASMEAEAMGCVLNPLLAFWSMEATGCVLSYLLAFCLGPPARNRAWGGGGGASLTVRPMPRTTQLREP